jgi:phosphate transport system protein
MDIGVLNVPTILTEMNGDPRRAAQMRLHGGPDWVWLPGGPGLPDGCHVVDVDAKFDHVEMLSGILPPEAYTPKERDPFVNEHTEDFQTQLQILRDQITEQGARVLEQATHAVDCYFDHDLEQAREVLQIELIVDKIDVEIEKQCIPLLGLGQTNSHAIRSVLTIVKVNNEFERIGDCAVTIAETTLDPLRKKSNLPQTFRVMANSVLGMVRDANRALSKNDPVLARRVLDFDDTVDRFKQEILLDAQKRLADGELAVDGVFRILAVTKSLERIADHCTNVCEQVIYLETGKIVRHDAEGWTQPQDPGSADH